MKILVTGSEGMLGEALIKTLLLRDDIERIYGVNRRIGFSPESIGHRTDKFIKIYTPLENEAYVQSLFKFIKPDIVFHLAASQRNTLEACDENTRMTNYILKHCPRGVRFIYASSSTVFGNLAEEIYNEYEEVFKLSENDITNPSSYYGASKLAGEHLVSVANLADKIHAVILRFCAIVGTGATHGAVKDIIKKAGAEGDSLELWGDSPGSTKPYIHITDAVGALVHFGLSDAAGVYNVCPADQISIDKLADVVMDNLGVKKTKVWNTNKKALGDNKLVTMDSAKALKAGWSPKYSSSKEAIAAVAAEHKRMVSEAHV